MHDLFHDHRARFDELLFGGTYDPDTLKGFWKHVAMSKDPRLANHPMIQRANWAEKAIPISLHGDGVPAIGVGKAGSKSYDCYSWQSLLAHGSTSTIKQYLFGIFDDCK
eukprot:13401228-Alexandrium_andersonii.AAC.1